MGDGRRCLRLVRRIDGYANRDRPVQLRFRVQVTLWPFFPFYAYAIREMMTNVSVGGDSENSGAVDCDRHSFCPCSVFATLRFCVYSFPFSAAAATILSGIFGSHTPVLPPTG